MATDGWVVSLTAVASNGNLTQLYPVWATAGVAKASSTAGQWIRVPSGGALHSIQIEPNGTDGGKIEIYDLAGNQAGADVSSATTITNAQLTAAITAGHAKLIWEQQFAGTVGTGPANASGIFRSFLGGLVARFSNAGPTGTCVLNLVVEGGHCKVQSLGGY
jgi:hypothetical protein